MKLKKIKTEAEIRAALNAETPGRPRVEMLTEDSTIKGVRIGQCHLKGGQYGSSLEVFREVEFDEASRYRVKAEIKGFPPQVDYFEDFGDARNKVASYDASTGVVVSQDQVRVLVDSDGKVVRELAEDELEGGNPDPAEDLVPF